MGKENIPQPPGVAKPKVVTEFPKYYWPPAGGEPIVAKSAGDVPAGYLPYNPADPERAAAAKAAEADKPALPMSKSEVVTALKEGGIPHDKKASHESLYELLSNGVKSALTEAGVEFDATETDVKKLLGLFPTS